MDLKKIKLPPGFDPTSEEDMARLVRNVNELAATKMPQLADYSLYRIDEATGYALYAPIDADTADPADARVFTVDAGRVANPKRTAQEYEQQHPGWFVTDINPVLRRVTMESLDGKTLTARRLFANALKVEPWAVRVTRTPEGGWKVRIDKNVRTYVPSQFDAKVQEVVEQVGKEGWFFRADPETNVIMVYPGVLPTFPKSIPMPEKVWRHPEQRRSYFGMRLPDRGRRTGDQLYNDWKDSPGVLVAGASNGGKSVVINSLISQFVAAGGSLAVVDDKGKSADFRWVRPWVIDRGWGCDGLESSAAVLRHVLDIVDARGDIIAENGASNWWELPDTVKREHPLLLLVCDEISQWAVAPKVPMGLDRDNPDLIQAKYEANICFASYSALTKISQKARYAGVCFLYCAQSVTQQAGLDPKVRINLTTKMAIGEKIQEKILDNVLNDAKHAPRVPQNVISEGVGRGCLIFESPGQETCVAKGYFESDPAKGLGWSDILRARVESLRPPTGGPLQGQLSWEDIVALVPAAVDRPGQDGLDSDDGSGADTSGFGVDGRDVADADPPLRGAAAAAHASKVTALQAARETARQLAAEGE